MSPLILDSLCNARHPKFTFVKCELTRKHQALNHFAIVGEQRLSWPVEGSVRTNGWSAREVLLALTRRHDRRGQQAHEWAFITELRVGANRPAGSRRVIRQLDPSWNAHEDYESRIDGYAFNVRRPHLIAYEVKVSRADFLAEVADEAKRAPAMALSNEFYFAAPEGLLEPHEIPSGCGLVAVSRAPQANSLSQCTRTHIVLQAPWRDIGDLPWSFLGSIALRAGAA